MADSRIKISGIKLKDNSPEVIKALNDSIEAALTKVGMDAEKYAKKELSGLYEAPKRVDTGLLRNSVTWAISGGSPNIQSYKADKGEKSGTYTGNAPNDGVKAVYLGTNVEYAIPVHEGTPRMTANRFIRNAVEKHIDEYKKTIEDVMK